MSSVQPPGLGEAIDAWRTQGADRFEPVRFRLIEALARRAQACNGAARAMLDERVATLLAAHVEAFEQWQARRPASPPPPARSALAGLLDQLARPGADTTAPLAQGIAHAAPAELKAVQQHRSTWARLSADQRLTQALAKVPLNAGPLNSQRLMHRSLALMREVSPGYLERFVSYVDALMWLDEVAGAGAPGVPQGTQAVTHATTTPHKAAPRPEPARKRPRSKPA